MQRLTSESYADKPTWSTAPNNEIAFESRTGARFDIKMIDVTTRQVKQLTFGEGSNESPVFSPNGRHLAFMSIAGGQAPDLHDDAGRPRCAAGDRDGDNRLPSWSK